MKPFRVGCRGLVALAALLLAALSFPARCAAKKLNVVTSTTDMAALADNPLAPRAGGLLG